MTKKQAPTFAKLKVPTQKLTILLLKDTIKAFDDAIKSTHDLVSHDLVTPNQGLGKLFLPKTQQKVPKWYYFVKQATGMNPAPPKNSTASALLILQQGSRFFALTFGMGRNLLKPDSFVLDFGLKVALNRVDKTRLKSVDVRTYEDFVITTRKQTSRNSELGSFGLDITKDLLRAVAGEPTDATFASRLVGSDSLTIFSAIRPDELHAKCTALLDAYEGKQYLSDYEWIDHLSEVRDPAIKLALEAQLVAALKAKDTTKMHLAPSESIDWHEVEKFKISGTGQKVYDDLNLDEYLLAKADKLADLTTEQLKNAQIKVQYSNSEHFMNKWHLHSCIVWETLYKKELYALVDGKWFRINKAFADRVKDYISQLQASANPLPAAKLGEDEDAYNARVAGVTPSLALLDRLLVKPTDYSTSVEVCDLFSLNKIFYHVKRKTSSATLSHLFAQGMVSAQAFLNDDQFRKEFRDRLVGISATQHLPLVPHQRPISSEYEIAYAVITHKLSTDWPVSLPFFSQLNLMQHAKLLKGFGFTVTIQQVLAN